MKNKLNYLKKKKKIIKNNNKLIIYKKKLLVMMKKQNFSQEIVLDLLKYCAWRTKKNLSGFSWKSWILYYSQLFFSCSQLIKKPSANEDWIIKGYFFPFFKKNY